MDSVEYNDRASLILAAALRYHREGLTVIPVYAGDKAPKITDWANERDQSEERVREIFRGHTGNIGTVCGSASRIVAVDVDVKFGKVGHTSFQEWEATHGKLPATMRTRSPSLGYHLILRVPAGFCVQTSHGKSMGADIDVQGEGAQVLLPPSFLVGDFGRDGKPQVPGPYELESDLPIADAPPALLECIKGISRRERESAAALDWAVVTEDDPSYEQRVKEQREGFRNAAEYKEGLGKGNVRYVMLFQRLGVGLRLSPEVTFANYAAEYDPRLEEKDRWLPRCEDELHNVIWRAYSRPMVEGYKPDQCWRVHRLMDGWCERARRASEVVIGTDLARVVNDAVERFAEVSDDVYQRAGELVRLVRVADADLTDGTPQLRTFPIATLTARMTDGIRWVKLTLDKTQTEKRTPVTPPESVVRAISELGEWPNVRPLTGIIEAPSMRKDGSIIQKAGYDAASGFLLEPGSLSFASVAESPTLEDARRALADLQDVFKEFPDRSPADTSVSIAALLTLIVRPAIAGNVPAFVFDAPTPGSGKSLKTEAISMIASE